jgi:carboxyl-terminal processing protease
MTEYRGYDPTPPARPAVALAAILLIALVFIVGVAVGQSGLLGGGPDTGVAPRPSPTVPATSSPSGPPASVGPGATLPPDAPLDFGLFFEALETIRQNYVGRSELDVTAITHGAIRGMIDALGDTAHSVFLTPEEADNEQNALDGSVVGIGVLLGRREEQVVIVSVISGSPAQEAGMRAGDRLLTVDGENVTELEADQVATRVRGEEGTEVVLSVARPATGETLDFTIARARIRIPAAAWTMVPGTDVALLRLVQFSAGSAGELQQARNEALAAGAQALILDLRGNPGGFVDQAVDVSSLFLSDSVVYIRELADGERIPVQTNPAVQSTELPLVVLIDQNTASSGEITAGAIATAGRAHLVGQTTFGTGTILLPFDLSDGSSIRLAVERWLTPDGELIFGNGIAPDVEVALPENGAPLEPDGLRGVAPADVAALGDSQLLTALELLGVELAAPSAPSPSP